MDRHSFSKGRLHLEERRFAIYVKLAKIQAYEERRFAITLLSSDSKFPSNNALTFRYT
ncbi:hypothetical protein QFZ80_005975 [Paenibacillus sp. V4I7]|nr:hypothetical protein [Paenibacillus sp. V4I7]MDQ0919359.1 hypothetical protein [Paenibacillus sp. V4I5]